MLFQTNSHHPTQHNKYKGIVIRIIWISIKKILKIKWNKKRNNYNKNIKLNNNKEQTKLCLSYLYRPKQVEYKVHKHYKCVEVLQLGVLVSLMTNINLLFIMPINNSSKNLKNLFIYKINFSWGSKIKLLNVSLIEFLKLFAKIKFLKLW